MNVETLINLTDQLTLYIPFGILIFGNIACILNLLTFSSKELRLNSCGWYFLMSSMSDFIFINFGLITKLSSDHFGSTYQNTSRIYCQIRIYLTWTLPCISTSYLVLSSLDRYLSTSDKTRDRLFSQIKIAQRITIIPIILYCLTNLHEFYYFDLRPKCVAQAGSYSIFLSIYSIVWTSLIPQCCLLMFGLLTFKNIRSIRQRLVRENETRNRTDIHLIKITLIQVVASSILLNIRTIYYSYYVLSTDLYKSEKQKALENLLYQLSNYFFFINFCKSFYLNTLMSKLFRQVLLKRLKFCLNRMTLHNFRVHPIQTNNTTIN